MVSTNLSSPPPKHTLMSYTSPPSTKTKHSPSHRRAAAAAFGDGPGTPPSCIKLGKGATYGARCPMTEGGMRGKSRFERGEIAFFYFGRE